MTAAARRYAGPPAGRDLLAGRSSSITAAAGAGIGSATARRCLAEGASVVISDQHPARLAAYRDELAGEYGDRSGPFPATSPTTAR